MTTYAYCTLTDVKNELRISDTNNDTVLQSYIYEVSEAINDYKGTIFQPVITTYNYDLSYVDQYKGVLHLNRDIVALSAVTFDDEAQTLSDYRLTPANEYPANYIYGESWTATEPDDIGITGTWCFHRDYSQAWRLQGTLSGDINASVTTIPVTATGLEIGQLLKIGSEILQITDVTGGTITADRGANGSTAASHTTGDTVEFFRPERVVTQACARWAALTFTRRAGFEQVQFNPDGTVIQYANDIPSDVKGLLDRLTVGLRITTV